MTQKHLIFQNSIIGVKPDVLAAPSLDSFIEFKYLTKKNQIHQCEAIIRCAMMSPHKIDGSRFFTFSTLADSLSLSLKEEDARATRNALYYIRSSLINKEFLVKESLSQTQQAALTELTGIESIEDVFYFVFPKAPISDEKSTIKSGGKPNIAEPYIEIDGEASSHGSLNVITHCLSRFMRVSKEDNRTSIQGTSKIKPSAADAKLLNAELTEIHVQSASLTTSEVMLSDDAVVCGYLYAQIIETIQNRIASIDYSDDKLKNVFSFPKNQILRHFKKTLGTGSRVMLDKIIERIVSTQFTLTQKDEFGDWFMKKVGLVDEYDNGLQQAPIRLLEPVGQTNATRDELGNVTYSTIVVALPDFVFKQIDDSIKQKKIDSMTRLYNPVYWRPQTLLYAKHNGLVNAILDKYKYWCSFPGSRNTISDIRNLYPLLYQLDKHYDVNLLTSRLIQALLDKPFAIAADQVINSSHRNRTRSKCLYALLDFSLLVSITCDHPNLPKAKLSHLHYTITVVCLGKQNASRLDLMLSKNKNQAQLTPGNSFAHLQQQYDDNQDLLRDFLNNPTSTIVPTEIA